MLRYDTQKTWFSRLVRHPARKWSGPILTTPVTSKSLPLPPAEVLQQSWSPSVPELCTAARWYTAGKCSRNHHTCPAKWTPVSTEQRAHCELYSTARSYQHNRKSPLTDCAEADPVQQLFCQLNLAFDGLLVMFRYFSFVQCRCNSLLWQRHLNHCIYNNNNNNLNLVHTVP